MAILTYTYVFSTATDEPPTGNQVRFNRDIANGTDKIWVRYLTADGIDAYFALMTSAADWTIWIQDKDDHTRFARFIQTGPPVDKGGYVELPVTHDADGGALVSQQIVLGLKSPEAAPVPPPSPPSGGGYVLSAPSAFPPHWAARVATAATVEPLSATELYQRARIVPGDEEDQALVASFIKAAREQVEQDTGCALPEQEIDVGLDTMPIAYPVALPWPPLQEIVSMTWTDSDGADHAVTDPAAVVFVDTLSIPARLWWKGGSTVPAATAWRLRLKVGWPPALMPELLKQAVGLLASHYLTAGRDRTVIGTSVLVMPAGYEDAIAPFVQIAVT